MEYYYHSKSRTWECDEAPNFGELGIPEETLKQLKDTHERSVNFVRVKNRYESCRYKDVKYLYYDIDDFAFFLKTCLVFSYSTKFSHSTSIYKKEEIPNYNAVVKRLEVRENGEKMRNFVRSRYQDFRYNQQFNKKYKISIDDYINSEIDLLTDNMKLYLAINPIQESEL